MSESDESAIKKRKDCRNITEIMKRARREG